MIRCPEVGLSSRNNGWRTFSYTNGMQMLSVQISPVSIRVSLYFSIRAPANMEGAQKGDTIRAFLATDVSKLFRKLQTTLDLPMTVPRDPHRGC
jgi:hypothetical protein